MAPADENGVQFADGLVDGNWLSERLAGVEILLLAACEADTIGDWLGVVPYVITFAEELGINDSAIITRHFWTAIARGKNPDDALDDALDHAAPTISEYVVRHW